jgi:hypothetical protein
MQVLLHDGLMRKERQSQQQGYGGENVERLIVGSLTTPFAGHHDFKVS